jgi:hypothetical protein
MPTELQSRNCAKNTDLEAELELSRDLIPSRSDSLPADTFGDLCQDQNVNRHGWRYSLETLSWAREIHSLSLVAEATIRAVFPLLSETLLHMEFFDYKLRIQQSLTNLSLVDDLLTIWSLSNRVTLDPKHQIDATLAVDICVMIGGPPLQIAAIRGKTVVILPPISVNINDK